MLSCSVCRSVCLRCLELQILSLDLRPPGEVGAEKAAPYGAGHVGLRPLRPPEGGAGCGLEPWETPCPGSRPGTVRECVTEAPVPGGWKSHGSWRARQELEPQE